MPAGPVGSVWAAGSWSDTAWEAGSWAGDVPGEPGVSAQAWSGITGIEPPMTGWPTYWVLVIGFIGGVLHVLR